MPTQEIQFVTLPSIEDVPVYSEDTYIADMGDIGFSGDIGSIGSISRKQLQGDLYTNFGRIGGDANYWEIGEGFIRGIGTGDVALSVGQTAYNTGIGLWLGRDSGTAKLSLGNPDANHITWDGSTLTIAGMLIAGSIHIPDVDTTANSFHVNTLGTMWIGSTQTNFIADNNNANAYILNTGVARFASVTITSGSSSITGGALVGSWITTSNTFYGLASGTPTVAPADGIVLTSGATSRMDIYEDTELRVRLGNLSAGVYGLRGFATNGTTTIFELSDTLQQIAGWNFTDTVLRTGATDAASNVLIDSANSLLRLGPTTGNFITADGANLRIRSSNYSTGVSGFTVEPGLIEAQNLLARGQLSGSVFRYDVISAIGGQVMVANSDTLSTAMTALDASTLTIRGTAASLAVNDILVIRAQTVSGIQEEWLRVTNIAAAPTYTVTRDLAGSFAADSNPIWPAGTPVVKQGVSDGAAAYSGGWLRLFGEGTNSPYYSVFERTGVAYNAYTERVRMGNLNGFLGYVADTFGFGVGSSSGTNANITIDPTNGIRVRYGTTNAFVVDNTGAITLYSNTANAITIDYGGDILMRQGGDINFTTVTTPGACTGALAGAGAGNVNNGTHSYRVSFVTASGETEYGTISNVVTVVDNTINGQISLTAIPTSSSSAVTARRLYRTKAGASLYFFLAEIADNLTIIYTDNTADAGLTGLGIGSPDNRENNSFGKIQVNGIMVFSASDKNTFIGQNSGDVNSYGYSNTGVGLSALAFNTTGIENTAFGSDALRLNTTGNYNVALGVRCLDANTTASSNIAIGSDNLSNNTGDANIAIGSTILLTNTGIQNIGIGGNTLNSNTSGYKNIGIGSSALEANTTGDNNIAIGDTALDSNIAGNGNVAIGYRALDAATGSGNVAIGYEAGEYETGSNAFYINNQDRINTAGDKAESLMYGTFNAIATLQTLTINAGTVTLGSALAFINDTSNAQMTVGLTINQGGADNQILAFKSSDVTHPFTGLVEADTFGVFSKADASAGGLAIISYRSSAGNAGFATLISGRLGEAADTTKSTAAIGVIGFESYVTDGGTSVAAVGADGNLLTISNGGTTRFIFDAEGDSHQDIGTAWTNFSVHDDIGLLTQLSVQLSKENDPIRKSFGEFLSRKKEDLENLGIVHFNEDTDGRAFINWSKTNMLVIGTLIQANKRIAYLEDSIKRLKVNLLLN